MFTVPDLPRTFRCGPLSRPPADANDVTDGEEPAGGPLAGQAVVVTGSMTGPLAALSRTR
ncbi:hypothetical protein ADK75_30295 [Streptomyces virginiae]|uniref:Uncharacterized protein n=1 Tax=Streptomyces virginiae TaxID=1961 RepID=A0A0L8M5M5_STRVG|nr:hypothetical protein ADK75_30295 [Streptomyces virginiae]